MVMNALKGVAWRGAWTTVSAPLLARWQWCPVVALVAAQAVLLSARFDTALLAERSGWWVAILELLPYTAHGLAFALGASLVLGAERIWAALPVLFAEPQERRPALWFLLSSQIGFALFALGLFGLIERPEAAPWLVQAALLSSALGAALWLTGAALTAVPARALEQFVANTGDRFLLGSLAGLGTFLAARAFEQQEFLWEPLSRATLVVAASLSRSLGLPLSTDINSLVLGTDRFAVVVTRFCSGYEGIGLYLLCTGSYLALARRKLNFPAALWILPAGALLVWLFNAARIAALVAIGHGWSAELAMEGFHTHAGWLPLIGISLGSVALASRHRLFAAGAPRDVDRPPSNPSAAHLMPLLTLIGLGLVAGSFLTDARLAAPLRALLGGFAIFYLRRHRAPLWSAPDRRLLWAAPLAVLIWLGSAAALGLLGEPAAAPALPGGLSVGAWWVLAVLSYALVTPIAEELAFRGFLQRRLIQRDFELVEQNHLTPLSVCATALLFGLLHGNLLGGVAIGGLLAWATTWRGKLSDAVQLHVAINLALVLVAFATGRHELWLGAAR